MATPGDRDPLGAQPPSLEVAPTLPPGWMLHHYSVFWPEDGVDAEDGVVRRRSEGRIVVRRTPRPTEANRSVEGNADSENLEGGSDSEPPGRDGSQRRGIASPTYDSDLDAFARQFNALRVPERARPSKRSARQETHRPPEPPQAASGPEGGAHDTPSSTDAFDGSTGGTPVSGAGRDAALHPPAPQRPRRAAARQAEQARGGAGQPALSPVSGNGPHPGAGGGPTGRGRAGQRARRSSFDGATIAGSTALAQQSLGGGGGALRRHGGMGTGAAASGAGESVAGLIATPARRGMLARREEAGGRDKHSRAKPRSVQTDDVGARGAAMPGPRLDDGVWEVTSDDVAGASWGDDDADDDTPLSSRAGGVLHSLGCGRRGGILVSPVAGSSQQAFSGAVASGRHASLNASPQAARCYGPAGRMGPTHSPLVLTRPVAVGARAVARALRGLNRGHSAARLVAPDSDGGSDAGATRATSSLAAGGPGETKDLAELWDEYQHPVAMSGASAGGGSGRGALMRAALAASAAAGDDGSALASPRHGGQAFPSIEDVTSPRSLLGTKGLGSTGSNARLAVLRPSGEVEAALAQPPANRSTTSLMAATSAAHPDGLGDDGVFEETLRRMAARRMSAASESSREHSEAVGGLVREV